MYIYCEKTNKFKKKDDGFCELSQYRKLLLTRHEKERKFKRLGGSGGYSSSSSSYSSCDDFATYYPAPSSQENEATKVFAAQSSEENSSDTTEEMSPKEIFNLPDEEFKKFVGEENNTESQSAEEPAETEDVPQAEEKTESSKNDSDWLKQYMEKANAKNIAPEPKKVAEAQPRAVEEDGEWLDQYLERTKVHRNSPEPKKFGAKAFTKDGEIYVAPGEEKEIPHELGHVVQQKTQDVPATDEIDGQKVNTDPKLEEEADEFAKSGKPLEIKDGEVKTKGVIQFEIPSDEELREIIEKTAERLRMTPIMNEAHVQEVIEEVHNAEYERGTFGWSNTLTEEVITKKLQKIKNNKNRELCEIRNAEIYKELESSMKQKPSSLDEEKENQRIYEIIQMLLTEKIFPKGSMPPQNRDVGSGFELNTIMKWLNSDQCDDLKNCILRLKKCCDAEGIGSVLEGADVNVMKHKTMLIELDEGDSSILQKKSFSNSFITRLKFMTTYIEGIYRKFEEQYWIRSTGSDPHKEGKHALFLVPKNSTSNEKYPPGTRVYKPRDLSADDAVVGQDGMFAKINKFFEERKSLEETIIKGENAFATMEITPDNCTEEFVTKEKIMTKEEAEKYFFRAGCLKVITDAMAVVDLHWDNIMPTKSCPLIIDAEVDFFRYSKSGLDFDALTKDEYQKGSSISTFNIEGENEPSGKLFYIPYKLLEQGETKKYNKLNSKKKVYYERYKEGHNFMLAQMKTNVDLFTQFYADQLQKVNKVRIVPIATPHFSEKLYDAIYYNTEKAWNVLSESLVKMIKHKLSAPEEKYIFNVTNSYLKVLINDNELKTAIIKTFENATIPALYIDMNSGKIYLDNSGDNKDNDENEGMIGKICWKQGTESVSKGLIIHTMTDSFWEEVNNKTPI